MGCFKDSASRVIPSLEGNQAVRNILSGHYKTRKNPVQKCYLAAKHLKYNFFAVQDGGACMSSKDAGNNYTKLGRTQACTSEKGGPMANYVWKIKSLPSASDPVPTRKEDWIMNCKELLSIVIASREATLSVFVTTRY